MNEELPEDWIRTTLGDVADVSGGIQKSPKRRPSKNPLPMLRVANVGFGSIDLDEVHEIEVFDGEEDRYLLKDGDILVVEGNGSVSQIGRAAMWRGEIAHCVHQNHLLRVRTNDLLPGFLELYLHSPIARSDLESVASSTSGLHVLSGAKLRRLPVVVPPIHEQLWIVEAVEEQLSRLEMAESSVTRAVTRLSQFRRAVVDAAIEPHYEVGTMSWSETGQTLSGRAFPSRDYADSGVRLLRPGNLHKSGTVTWSAKATRYLPGSYAESNPKYLFRGRHLFMNLTAQSLADDFLGRVCLSAQDDEFLLNQRIAYLASDRHTPEYLACVFNSSRFRRFVASLNTGSLIQHISTKALRDFEIPLVDAGSQREAVAMVDVGLAQHRSVLRSAERAVREARALRRAVLDAAFRGQLAARDSKHVADHQGDDDPSQPSATLQLKEQV